MAGQSDSLSAPSDAPIPRTFGQYIRSFGPGIVIVLTWLGAGDVVDAAAAGAALTATSPGVSLAAPWRTSTRAG